jgi:uncharacterized protein (DUF1778 family)
MEVSMRTHTALQETKTSAQFNIRLAVENKEKIERAARAMQQTLTEFAEKAMLASADAVLERQKQIQLSDRDFERFAQMMSEDAEPTETALREAAEFNTGRLSGGRYQW